MSDSLQHRLGRLLHPAGEVKVKPGSVRRRPAEPLPPGREVENERGAYYLVEVPFEKALHHEAEGSCELEPPPWSLDDGPRGRLTTERPLFLDLETTGLSSSPLFLVTTLSLESADGSPIFRQRFARDYTEEDAVIHDIVKEINESGSLITYNGKSYDLPFFERRAAYHRISFVFDSPHADLLHICRRKWKGRFPNFKLQTMEDYVVPLSRANDIPSADIPGLYHRWVRDGFDPRMRSVFRHNLRDVLTMVRLFALLVNDDGKRRNED